jgi:hypothetical protein
MHSHVERRPQRKGKPNCFDPHEGQIENRCRRYDDCTGMHDGLAKWAFHRIMFDGCLCGYRRPFSRGFDGAVKALGQGVDMRLGDIALQRPGERHDEQNEAPRQTHAPDSRMSDYSSRHETRDQSNSTEICNIGHSFAIGRTCSPRSHLRISWT